MSFHYWTDEQLAMAADMWAKGLSAGKIAARLEGDITRSAVAGKMNRHRDIFPLRNKTSAHKPPRLPKPQAAVPAVRLSFGSTPRFETPKRSAMLADLNVPVQVPTRPNGHFRHRGLVLKGGAPDGVPFGQLKARACAWPLTDFEDADGPDMPCCGRPRRGGVAPDSPYCAEHAAVARGSA